MDILWAYINDIVKFKGRDSNLDLRSQGSAGRQVLIYQYYQYLDDFADKVVKQIEEIVRKMSLI